MCHGDAYAIALVRGGEYGSNCISLLDCTVLEDLHFTQILRKLNTHTQVHLQGEPPYSLHFHFELQSIC